MRTVLACTIGAFLAGGILGWVGGTYQQAVSTQEAVLTLKSIELSEAEKRAIEAYETQPPEVAIWELTHTIELLQEAAKTQQEGSKSMRLKLFLAHARLSRLFDMRENQEQGQEHFQNAVHYYNIDHPEAKIGEFHEMLERLKQFDRIEGIDWAQ